jgi:hypothetical protein
MLKRMFLMWVCLTTIPALSQSPSKYELATITDTKPHQPGKEGASDGAIYDVSLRVGGTTYVVRYTDRSGTSTVKYAAGRSVLVLIGKNTITYNDILGRSVEMPIVSRTPAADAKLQKPEGK